MISAKELSFEQRTKVPNKARNCKRLELDITIICEQYNFKPKSFLHMFYCGFSQDLTPRISPN